ncbi:Gfo/Idh/MocA family protein [Enterococcus sp. LJL98]
MKVGIIGCAHMQAETSYLMLKQMGVEVTGVFDRNPIRGSAFAKEHHLPFFPSLDKILKTGMDTAMIFSENSLHYDYTLACAFHKIHVIVEKPLALKVEDAKRMILACQENGVKLFVSHPVRYAQTMIELKQRFDAGELGKILAVVGTNHGKNPGGWFLDKEFSGGGALLDHMVHLIDLSKWIFNFEIASIYARTNCHNYDEIEDSALLHIHFTNGVFMSLDTSWNRPDTYPVWGDATLKIITDKGTVFADGFGRRSDIYLNQPFNVTTLSDIELKRTAAMSHFYEKSMTLSMLEDFKRAIDDDLPVTISGLDGLYPVEIAELAYQSAHQKKIIQLK